MHVHSVFWWFPLFSHYFDGWIGFKTSNIKFIQDKILVQKTDTVFVFCSSGCGNTTHRQHFPQFCHRFSVPFLVFFAETLLHPHCFTSVVSPTHTVLFLYWTANGDSHITYATASAVEPWLQLSGWVDSGELAAFQWLKAKCCKDHKSEDRCLRQLQAMIRS